MSNRNLLVTFMDNWSDEFDVDGMNVMTEKEWSLLQWAIKKADYPLEIYFGTNEFLEYDDADTLLNCYSVHDIEQEHVVALSAVQDLHFPFGVFPERPDFERKEDE